MLCNDYELAELAISDLPESLSSCPFMAVEFERDLIIVTLVVLVSLLVAEFELN